MTQTATITRTLHSARADFITTMNRDTASTERPRLLAVLDVMIAWSLARPKMLRFRVDETKSCVVSFERIDTSEIFWSAVPARGDAPKLMLIPRAASVLSLEQRADAMDTVNANSRESLTADDKLRIGFGALKNTVAREAVLSMMQRLLITE